LVLMTVYIPVVAEALRVVNPGQDGWLLILGMSFVPLLFGQIVKLAFGRKGEA
jgi:Ca2+-transporting ATPase